VRQLEGGFQGVSAEAAARVVVAYEPIWAIGTGRTASAADAEEMCKAIRAWLAANYGTDLAGRVRVQYGGSVTPSNIAELMAEDDIDGALVGGASLDAQRFSQIVRFGRS
jgi:triosephosphate isomerase (TIM)